jgi:hypothetical protein
MINKALRTMFLFTIMLVTACASAHPVKEEFRTLTEFTGIKANGAFIITVVQGKGSSVKIEAEQQMLSRIRTEVKDGILSIYTEGKTETENPMMIYVTTEQLKKAEMNGASRLRSETDLHVNELTLKTSGAGSIDLKVKAAGVDVISNGAGKIELCGSALKLTATLSGASSLNAYDLQTDFASVKTTDASNAKITANDTFNGQANGASYINYKGAPGKKKINTTGASFIEKAGA